MGTTSSPASRRSDKSELLGKETPRLFTPPLRELNEDTSLGFECIKFASDVLGVELYPWQKWLLIHALELNEDGAFRFRKVFVLVGRQNGKSTLLQILTLWRMYVDGAPLVLGTAQDRNIAREQWLGAVEIAQNVDELASGISEGSPVTSRGFEKFVLDSGERYEIAASNRRAGRGLSVDLLLMDELREHQTWDSWSAVSKTTNARPNGQVWAVSNAGDAASVVLRHFRTQAHIALGDPDKIVKASAVPAEEIPDDVDAADDSLGLFEWSAPPGCSIWDKDGWAQANPSLGYGALELRTIRSDAKHDPEWIFRTEVLCQWVNLAGTGPFPTGSWAKTSVPTVERDTSRPAVYGLDLSFSRTMAYIAIAFWDTEGRKRVEIAAQRAGTDWIIPWLLDPKRRVKPDHVTLQAKGAPISSMKEPLEAAGLTVHDWSGSNLAAWTGQFYDEIRKATGDDDAELTLTHGVWPALDIAANSARIKPMGDGWTVDRKSSPEDAAPLMAAIGAVGLLTTAPATQLSAYESAELVFLD